jgi:hypothetical protein
MRNSDDFSETYNNSDFESLPGPDLRISGINLGNDSDVYTKPTNSLNPSVIPLTQFTSRIDDLTTEISNATNRRQIPELLPQISQILQDVSEIWTATSPEFSQILQQTTINLNNACTIFLSKKFFKGATLVYEWCRLLLNPKELDFDPSLLVNTLNNYGNCYLRFYKTHGGPKNPNGSNSGGKCYDLLTEAKHLINKHKLTGSKGSHCMNLCDLYCWMGDCTGALEFAQTAGQELQSSLTDLDDSNGPMAAHEKMIKCRLLALAHYKAAEELTHCQNFSNALNYCKKAINTVKRFFGDHDPMFRRFQSGYERISKRHNDALGKKPHGFNVGQQPKVGRGHNTSDLSDKEGSLGNQTFNSNAHPYRITDPVKAGILKSKPGQAEIVGGTPGFGAGFKNGNSRGSSNPGSQISTNKNSLNGDFPMNNLNKTAEIKTNMMSFFDNLINFVGPNHSLSTRLNPEVKKHFITKNRIRVEDQISRRTLTPTPTPTPTPKPHPHPQTQDPAQYDEGWGSSDSQDDSTPPQPPAPTNQDFQNELRKIRLENQKVLDHKESLLRHQEQLHKAETEKRLE